MECGSSSFLQCLKWFAPLIWEAKVGTSENAARLPIFLQYIYLQSGPKLTADIPIIWEDKLRGEAYLQGPMLSLPSLMEKCIHSALNEILDEDKAEGQVRVQVYPNAPVVSSIRYQCTPLTLYRNRLEMSWHANAKFQALARQKVRAYLIWDKFSYPAMYTDSNKASAMAQAWEHLYQKHN